MSLDRFGKRIYFGWHPHEDRWIDAALTLPQWQRADAFRDIGLMSGRSTLAVQNRAWKRATAKRGIARTVARNLIDGHERRSREISRIPPCEPKRIPWPTPAQMMGAR